MCKTFLALAFAVVIIFCAAIDLNAQQICTQQPQGIVSWWDAEGDANDIVGGNNGSLENGAGFGTGMVGQAFQFDGVNDFVKVPYAGNLSPGDQLSLEFWMKGDASNPMNACCQGFVGTDFYKVEGFDYDRGIAFVVSTNGGTSYVGAGTLWGGAYPSGFGLTPGQWHHVAGTSDGSLLKLYVDGHLRSAMVQLSNISPMPTTSFLAFGSEDGERHNPSATAGRYFFGLIDEISIYNRALSAEEVGAIFAAGNRGKCKGVPFADLSASLAINLGTTSHDDSFDLRATITQGQGSDGINPLTEAVGLRLGAFSIIIPAGSFTGKQPRFKGQINGVNIDASFSFSGGTSFQLRINGSGADLSGIVSPGNVEITVGDNGAIATLSQVQITATTP
jgi:Concanavalin A-like lectin/glucanases superfamily